MYLQYILTTLICLFVTNRFWTLTIVCRMCVISHQLKLVEKRRKWMWRDMEHNTKVPHWPDPCLYSGNVFTVSLHTWSQWHVLKAVAQGVTDVFPAWCPYKAFPIEPDCQLTGFAHGPCRHFFYIGLFVSKCPCIALQTLTFTVWTVPVFAQYELGSFFPALKWSSVPFRQHV